MGVDEALLASAIAGGPPSVRLYGWDGAWLSLGYAQSLAPGRLEACRRVSVGVVRRSTGGRAVLHGGDLTYAVAAPERFFPAGLQASYALVADALTQALRSLGIEAERSAAPPSLEAGARQASAGFDCFAAPAMDEICAGGRKLAGSAQRRTGGGVLQHGSIRLWPDSPEARAASGLANGAATSLAELGVEPPWESVRDRFRDALEDALGVRFEPGSLTPGEVAQARTRGLRLESPGLCPRGESAASIYPISQEDSTAADT
jgi:lipoate-protein ligase A